MSAVDGRGFAWCQAASLLDWAADTHKKIVEGKGFNPDAPLPEFYWSVVAQAAIYAELAKADVMPGFVGGEWLERKREDEREAAEFSESLFEKMAERVKPTEGEGDV